MNKRNKYFEVGGVIFDLDAIQKARDKKREEYYKDAFSDLTEKERSRESIKHFATKTRMKKYYNKKFNY
jgi:hypothetical protein